MKIRDKVFVVTGAANGMGRHVALLLVDKGARVAAVDIDEAGLKAAVALAGPRAGQVSTHVIDVVDRSATGALPDAVVAAHDAVDGLVNVAGIIHRFARLNELDFGEIERVLNINLYGVLNMTKAFLPHLLKRPTAHITIVSSMASYAPVPGQAIYGASKAAVKMLAEGLNSELRGTDVRVSVVFPGAVRTEIAVNSGAMTPQENEATANTMRMLPAPVAAAKIVRGIEKDSYRVFAGFDAFLLDKLNRVAPQLVAKLINRQMRDVLPPR
ncbi:SDR family NAD(P)-dependent oxidoreductase [Mycobacterium hubeiense]|uniref:SDR family NAD(P)-dependent oxidoreductase n=1 Tax=Mycobacterium hubeiense TaxID=1867256 RepID=UPI000C7EEE36|nr:SDR family oxidoreductase [Mycobacterium sp. QGD 101]